MVDPLGLCPCSQIKQAAADLAKAFEQEAHVADFFAVSSGLATGLAGAGEGVTLGGDSPVTITFGAATGFFTTVSFASGEIAATLNGLAGSGRATVNFSFTEIEGALAATAARRVPGLNAFADTIGDLTGQAADLVTQSKEACK